MIIIELFFWIFAIGCFAVAFLALAINLAHALDPEIDDLVQSSKHRSKANVQLSEAEEEDDSDEFYLGVRRFGDRLPPTGFAA